MYNCIKPTPFLEEVRSPARVFSNLLIKVTLRCVGEVMCRNGQFIRAIALLHSGTYTVATSNPSLLASSSDFHKLLAIHSSGNAKLCKTVLGIHTNNLFSALVLTANGQSCFGPFMGLPTCCSNYRRLEYISSAH